MRMTRRYLMACLTAAALFGTSAQAAVVTFNDSALEDFIRDLINKPTGDILDTDVDDITTVQIDGLGVSDLTGMEFFTGLRNLTMDDNNVSDLSPIAGIIGLITLEIRNNPITDLSALSAMTILSNLRLGTSGITPDFASINGLNLFLLRIDGPTLTDIDALDPSTTLQILEVNDLGLTDISAVAGFTNLRILSIENNAVSDISALASLTALEQLFADGNQIADIAALTGKAALEHVRLSGSPIMDLSPLATLTSLDFLDLSNTGLSDVSDLSGLSTTLTHLSLMDNTISDLTPLAGLTGLETLIASLNDLTSADGLSGLPNLQTVNLIDNQITDISALVLNIGIGAGDTIQLLVNPLSQTAKCNDVPELRDRGALVVVTEECDVNLFPCPLWPTVNQQGESAFPVLGEDWQDGDANGDGMPDRWQARLVAHVVCQNNHPLNSLTADAFAFNLGSLAAEGSPELFTVAELHEVRHVMAALLLISETGRDNLAATLDLIRPYVVVDLTAKTINEPFSADGDLDGDGVTNLQEYLNVIANGGDIEFYLLAATSPNLDGTESLPISSGMWLVLLVTIVAALGARRRCHVSRT